MRSLRFLLSRRWALFFLAVVVLVVGTWWLGQWQFHRLHDRKAENAVVRANETKPPAPVGDVLAVGRRVPEDDEWRRVTATGRYAVEDSVVVRYRTREGAPGIDVVVPLVTADGPALLVDRGWMQTANEDVVPALPAPPAGEVTVSGWVRADATGRGTRVALDGDVHSTRAISSEEIGPAIDRTLYAGFVDLQSESPQPARPLARVELPELDNGPHFFYGIQWWFFGALAVFGFGYLLHDEWRVARGGRAGEQRARERSEKAAARDARMARKQAVKDAYQAAYARDRSARSEAPGGPDDRDGRDDSSVRGG